MRTLHHLLTLLLAVSIFGVAYGDDAAVRRYRDYTPEQIREIPAEKWHSDVPMMYTIAAQRGLLAGSELIFAMELNQLMYPGVHDYNASIKAFQTDLGDKATGVLTVWQIHQLELRSSMQKLSPVGFPDSFLSDIRKHVAYVHGTMVLVDDEIAWPINHVRVFCSKSDNVCRMDQLHLSLPDANSWAQMYNVMEAASETYEIARWSQDSIESHPLGTSEDCRNTSLSFNFKTKEFYFITRNAGGDCRLLPGTELPKLTKPRVAQIVNGKKIIQEKFVDVQNAAFQVLSSDFRRRAEAVNVQEKAQ